MVPGIHSLSPCLTGACSTGGARARPPTHPNSYRHFTARYKASSPAQVGGVGVLLVPATGGCCGGQAQAARHVVSEGPLLPPPAPLSAVAPGVSLGQLPGPEAAGHPPPLSQPVLLTGCQWDRECPVQQPTVLAPSCLPTLRPSLGSSLPPRPSPGAPAWPPFSPMLLPSAASSRSHTCGLIQAWPEGRV